MKHIIQFSITFILGSLMLFASPTEAQQIACYQPAQLSVGMHGRVTLVPDLPNRLRSDPSFRNNVIGNIAAGSSFVVIEGPVCSEGINWYRVRVGSPNGPTGWTAEGNGYNSYWLELVPMHPGPVFPPVTPQPAPCTLIPRLTIGQQGQVTPGLPNVIRTEPGTNATGAINSRVIGEIPANGIFDVYNGPQCGSDGRWWWLVNYNGVIGWTAEGEGNNSYWLTPYSFGAPLCTDSLPPRLNLYQLGRVTTYPNLPNRLRTQPSTSSTVLGQMQPGDSFHVLSGPYCNERTTWWQVEFGNIVGWTAEGGGATYWLEPVNG